MFRPDIFLAAFLLGGSMVAHAEDFEAVPQNELAVTDLIGRDVLDVEGNHVGQVTDLVVDNDQRVAAVVVEIGGFLGIGGKPVLLEASNLRADEQDSVRVGLSQPQLERLPTLE